MELNRVRQASNNREYQLYPVEGERIITSNDKENRISSSYSFLMEEYRDIIPLKNHLEELTVLYTPKDSAHESGTAKKGNIAGSTTAEICLQEINAVHQTLTRKTEPWALQMLDASSKIPSGILEGNIVDLGMYDECISIEGNWSKIQVRGQYCTYSPEISMDNASFLPTLAICVPDSCSASDVYKFLNASIATINKKFRRNFPNLKLNASVGLNSVTCLPPLPTVWDVELIVFWAIFCTYLCFLIVCIVCDEYQKRKRVEDSENEVSRTLGRFSPIKNATAIFGTQEKKGTFPAIHGLRFFSMAWIVSSHEYVAQFQAVNVNSLDFFRWLRSWNSLQLFAASFAVDTFLTLTGFLMTYLFLKNIQKQKSFNVPIYYLYRYLRLAPLVLILSLITMIVVPKIGSGPRWHQIITSRMQYCRSEWWTYVFFIQNFNDVTYCLPHLWYLSMDMQLFWISPVILYPLYKKPKFGSAFLVALVLFSLIIPAYVIVRNEYPILSYFTETTVEAVRSKAAMKNAYMMPYCRATPWLVGILCGFIMARDGSQPNKLVVRMGWLITFACFTVCIFGTRHFVAPSYKYNIITETIFWILSKLLWGYAICWIIYASHHHKTGPVSVLLSWKFLLPFSRLSYAVYLLHPIIQFIQLGAQRTPKYFSDFFTFNSFLSDFAICIIVAFFFNLLFESPLIVLEKMMLKKSQGSEDPLREVTLVHKRL